MTDTDDHYTVRLTVACVLRSSDRFTVEYVDRLYRSLLRFDRAVDLVCLSDVPVPCRRVALGTNLPGWWAKMELFRPGLFTGQQVLYLDLDTVVVRDPFMLASHIGETMVLSDLYDPTNMASGVMTWHGDAMRHIWNDFAPLAATVVKQHHRRMDHYLRRFLHNETRIQDAFPGQVVSYKADIRGRREPYNSPIVIPEEARLVCFHGKPTPADLDVSNPVRREWGP